MNKNLLITAARPSPCPVTWRSKTIVWLLAPISPGGDRTQRRS